MDKNKQVELREASEGSQKSMQVATNSNALMQLVQTMATSKDVDLDRVERAFSIYEKVRLIDTEAQYNTAMASAQMEIGSVIANRKNEHNGSLFADLSAIHGSCKPIWAKHGFSVSSEYYDAQKDNWLGVKCQVMHSSGFSKEYKNIFPLDIAGARGSTNKTPIQAVGSTGSYARRYIEMMVFDISVDRDDDGAQTVTNRSVAPQEITNIYPQDAFDRQFPAWMRSIQSGEKTTADVMKSVSDFLSRKGLILSDQQKQAIKGVRVQP